MQRAIDTAATRILAAAIRAADPYTCVHTALTTTHAALLARQHSAIVLIGAGKAAVPMAAAAADILAPLAAAASIPFSGHVVTKYNHIAASPYAKHPSLAHIVLAEAAHPVPDENSLAAGAAILAAAAAASDAAPPLAGHSSSSSSSTATPPSSSPPRPLIVNVLSGGASALADVAAGPLSLADLRVTVDALLASGASIDELNTVRKHLSAFKGGSLARAAPRAHVLTLALSDVVGDPLDVIGSGPTVADPTTPADAAAIIDKYALAAALPPPVVDWLAAPPTPAPPSAHGNGDDPFALVTNAIVGSNALALDAAADAASALGFTPLVLASTIEGPAATIAPFYASIARELATHARPVAPPACVLTGGETTVVLGPDFDAATCAGGRNQELALAAALALHTAAPDFDAAALDVAILAAGTDGTDGPTDAAGGLVSHTTVAHAPGGAPAARAALAAHDAYHWLASAAPHALVKTGPTGTNVMDLTMVLVAPPDYRLPDAAPADPASQPAMPSSP